MLKIYDLSVTMANYAYDPRPPKIVYTNHEDSTRFYGGLLGLGPHVFPGGHSLAAEEVTAITHSGTHLDAPWHYGPTCEGKRAKTIEEVPLEWCFGHGVVLDFRHKKSGESITKQDVLQILEKIDYTLKPFDIVLLMVLGGDKYLTDPDYYSLHAGLSTEALFWMLEQGIKVLGTDGWGFDKPFGVMKKEYLDGNEEAIWPAHFAGREKEYCHIEKLANLDKLPKPHGFTVATFPIKLAHASAGWCRTVAIFDE